MSGKALAGLSSKLLFVLAFTTTVSAPVAAQGNSGKPDFAIVGINVIPMDEERLLENQVVVVADGMIQSVSDAAATTLPASLRQIPGDGQFLMPGLADLHVHFRHEDELINTLAWGVTTIMHLGGSDETGRRLLRYRADIRDGSRLGPNIYTTGRILDGDPAVGFGARSLSTVQDARAAVRDLKSNGFDFVKIYNNVSRPVFDAIVDEAKRQHLAVLGHIPRNFDALSAFTGGQNAVVHTEEFFFTYFQGPRRTNFESRQYEPDLGKLPALIEVLVEADVAVMPDLSFTFTNLLMWDDLDIVWNDPEFAYLQPDIASSWLSGGINRRDNLANFMVREQWKYHLMQTLTIEFQKAGILQVVGTDAALPGLYPGKAVHRELTELVKAGITVYDALAMGTRNAGDFVQRYIDHDTRVGQIRPGYRADFLILNANPLQDIRNARDVAAVVVYGKYTAISELDELRAGLRTRYDVLHNLNRDIDAALALEQADPTIRDLLKVHADNTSVLQSVERRINAAGYAALFADDFDRSQRILSLNTRLFPQSANTWDSLAELALNQGDRELALQLYRKALEVDPTFTNAADNIERILDNAK